MCRHCEPERERHPNGELVLTKDERYEEDRFDSTFDFPVGSDEYHAIVGKNLDL